MSASAGIPSAASVLRTLVAVTWRRLFRGRALWVSVLIASLPVVLAAGLKGTSDSGPAEFVQFLVMALLPPMFVASSLGEEIEDRTTTYLWSRPLARWTIVVGKLLALAPLAIILVVGGFALTYQILDKPLPAHILGAMAGGTFAIAALSAGLATLVPKHGMALSIVYLVVFDIPLGALPSSISGISITRQVSEIIDADSGIARPAITLAVVAALWIGVALWRIRRLES